MSPKRGCIAFLLSFALTASALLAAPQTPPPTSQDPPPAASSPKTPASGQLQPASHEGPQTPAAKPAPKKVYTNENMPTAGHESPGGIDFGGINNCNRNCFEQVRQLTRVAPGANPNWKRDLLSAIETVRKDTDWQQYLREIYDLHLRFCKLGEEKREELAKVADPNNVTPRELTVDEKYDLKFKKAQSDLETVYSRQRSVQQKFAVNPYAFQFSQLQIGRLQGASCYSNAYAAGATDADDP